MIPKMVRPCGQADGRKRSRNESGNRASVRAGQRAWGVTVHLVVRQGALLHEGDTSVARPAPPSVTNWFQSPSRGGSLTATMFQSPSRGGHLRGRGRGRRWPRGSRVSVPFTRGTPPWRRVRRAAPLEDGEFQSPSRGGHLRGRGGRRGCGATCIVSVPFTRGTPPWPDGRVYRLECVEVSVPFTRGTPPWHRVAVAGSDPPLGFSPLHEGDTSVASGVADLRR